jgi:hypothetical protein
MSLEGFKGGDRAGFHIKNKNNYRINYLKQINNNMFGNKENTVETNLSFAGNSSKTPTTFNLQSITHFFHITVLDCCDFWPLQNV